GPTHSIVCHTSWRGGEPARAHDRRVGAGRPAAPTATGVSRSRRAAMWLLHARHDYGQPGPALAVPKPKRGTDYSFHARQHLPLWNISAHHPRYPAGRNRAAYGATRRAMNEERKQTSGPAAEQAGGGQRPQPREPDAPSIGDWLHIELHGTVIVYTRKAQVGQNIR